MCVPRESKSLRCVVQLGVEGSVSVHLMKLWKQDSLEPSMKGQRSACLFGKEAGCVKLKGRVRNLQFSEPRCTDLQVKFFSPPRQR